MTGPVHHQVQWLVRAAADKCSQRQIDAALELRDPARQWPQHPGLRRVWFGCNNVRDALRNISSRWLRFDLYSGDWLNHDVAACCCVLDLDGNMCPRVWTYDLNTRVAIQYFRLSTHPESPTLADNLYQRVQLGGVVWFPGNEDIRRRVLRQVPEGFQEFVAPVGLGGKQAKAFTKEAVRKQSR